MFHIQSLLVTVFSILDCKYTANTGRENEEKAGDTPKSKPFIPGLERTQAEGIGDGSEVQPAMMCAFMDANGSNRENQMQAPGDILPSLRRPRHGVFPLHF